MADGTPQRTTGGHGVRLQLALGMLLFGSATPVAKLVGADFPPFVGAGLRVAIGALALLPAALARRDRFRKLTRRDWLLTSLIALFGMFGFTALMLYGMALVPGTLGAVVMSTTPAVTAAGAMLLLGESATWRKLTAIGLAVGGVLLLQFGGGGGEAGGSPWLGALLVFAAVCCEAAYTLLGKRASEHADPILVACLAAALSLPLFLPLALWQLGDFHPAEIRWQGWAALAWYGAGTLALGTWFWYAGVARAEGSVAAGFMGLMPVSALLLSYLLLDEAFRWIQPVGFAVVFAGVLLMAWEHARAASGRQG
jgi:drug/metabolite transporter (DMT)-like permease